MVKFIYVLCDLATNNIVIDMQNQMRTNEIRIDLLRKQNDSLKTSLEKLLSMNNGSPSSITEERYEEIRNQSRQEQRSRRYSYGNETVSSVNFTFPLKLKFIFIFVENKTNTIMVVK